MTRDEALKKIKKCLAMSRSANEAEAATALRQAQKLMEQFKLEDTDISLLDVGEAKARASSTAANAWELRLVRLVADAFGCEHGELEKGSVRNTLKGRKMDHGHFAAGFRAGESAQLQPGIGGMPAQGLLT